MTTCPVSVAAVAVSLLFSEQKLSALNGSEAQCELQSQTDVIEGSNWPKRGCHYPLNFLEEKHKRSLLRDYNVTILFHGRFNFNYTVMYKASTDYIPSLLAQTARPVENPFNGTEGQAICMSYK